MIIIEMSILLICVPISRQINYRFNGYTGVSAIVLLKHIIVSLSRQVHLAT